MSFPAARKAIACALLQAGPRKTAPLGPVVDAKQIVGEVVCIVDVLFHGEPVIGRLYTASIITASPDERVAGPHVQHRDHAGLRAQSRSAARQSGDKSPHSKL
jgi:hypothetical protein